MGKYYKVRGLEELIKLFPAQEITLSKPEYQYLTEAFDIEPAVVCGCNFEIIQCWDGDTVTMYAVSYDCPHGVPANLTLFTKKSRKQVILRGTVLLYQKED